MYIILYINKQSIKRDSPQRSSLLIIESVMNPTIEEIRRELNKTFESVSEKWVKTSSILKKLNLIEQRQSTFSPESLIKLYIYRRIKGIHYYMLVDRTICFLQKNRIILNIRGFTYHNAPTPEIFQSF